MFNYSFKPKLVLKPDLHKNESDEGSYTLSHTYDPICCHAASLSWQELEEELNKLRLMKVSDKDRNIKVENVWLS